MKTGMGPALGRPTDLFHARGDFDRNDISNTLACFFVSFPNGLVCCLLFIVKSCLAVVSRHLSLRLNELIDTHSFH